MASLAKVIATQFAGVPRLLQKISVSGAAACTAIATTAIDASLAARPAGATILIQGNAAFRFLVARSSASTLTDTSGLYPGMHCQADTVYTIGPLDARDTHLDLLSDSGTTVVTVWLQGAG